jgi:hypothetical protein
MWSRRKVLLRSMLVRHSRSRPQKELALLGAGEWNIRPQMFIWREKCYG